MTEGEPRRAETPEAPEGDPRAREVAASALIDEDGPRDFDAPQPRTASRPAGPASGLLVEHWGVGFSAPFQVAVTDQEGSPKGSEKGGGAAKQGAANTNSGLDVSKLEAGNPGQRIHKVHTAGKIPMIRAGASHLTSGTTGGSRSSRLAPAIVAAEKAEMITEMERVTGISFAKPQIEGELTFAVIKSPGLKPLIVLFYDEGAHGIGIGRLVPKGDGGFKIMNLSRKEGEAETEETYSFDRILRYAQPTDSNLAKFEAFFWPAQERVKVDKILNFA